MSNPDQYAQGSVDVSSQARGAMAVTPDDDTDLSPYAKALYIGSAGDISVIPINQDTPVLFANHPVGYMPVQVKRVMATDTLAGGIVALTTNSSL